MKLKNWPFIVKIVAIGVIGILCVSAGIAIGKITVRPVEQHRQVVCPMCQGSGQLFDDKTGKPVKCPECDGTGKTDSIVDKLKTTKQ